MRKVKHMIMMAIAIIGLLGGTGCLKSSDPKDPKDPIEYTLNGDPYTIVIIDSCEFIVSVYVGAPTHRPRCKFCKERKEKELKNIRNENK